MKHVILSEDRNGTGTIARVCRRPDGSYAVELVAYDLMGRLGVQTIIADGWSVDLLRHALVDSWESESDLIARGGGRAGARLAPDAPGRRGAGLGN
jgi:hypothetical protein